MRKSSVETGTQSLLLTFFPAEPLWARIRTIPDRIMCSIAWTLNFLNKVSCLQGELSEAVKALDLGTKAAEQELKLASETARQLVRLAITTRPEPRRAAAPAASVGKLKVNPLQQRLMENQSSGLTNASQPIQASPSSAGTPVSK